MKRKDRFWQEPHSGSELSLSLLLVEQQGAGQSSLCFIGLEAEMKASSSSMQPTNAQIHT